MAEDTATVELLTLLTAKVDQLYSALSEASDRIHDYGTRAKEENEKTANSFIAVAAGIDYVVDHLDEYLAEMVRAAAVVQTQSAVLTTLATRQGETSDGIRELQEGLEGLGYSANASNVFLLKLTQAHVGYSQALGLAKVAQDLAATGGRQLNDVLETLGQSVLSGNARILRQYGIVTNVSSIFRDYAGSVGKTVEQLTDMDRRQAVINAILQSGTVVAGAHGAAMDTVGGKYEVFSNQLNNFKDQVGSSLLPMLDALLGAGLKLVEFFNSMPYGVKVAAGSLLAFTAGMASILALAFTLLAIMPKLVAFWAAFNTTVLATPFAWVFGIITAAVIGVNAALAVWDRHLEESNAHAIETLRSIRDGAAATTEQLEAMSEAGGQKSLSALQILEARKKMLTDIINGEVKLTTYAREQAQQQLQELESIEAAVRANAKAVDQAKLLADHAKEVASAWEKGNQFMQTAADSKLAVLDREYATAVEEAQKEITNATAREKALTDLKIAYTNRRMKIEADETMKYNSEAERRYEKDKQQLALTEKEYSQHLKQMLTMFVYSAKEREAISNALADSEKKNSLETLAAQKRDLKNFESEFAAQVATQLDLWNLHAFKMVDVWHNMINKMVQELIASGLIDLMSIIFTGGTAGALGNTFVGGLLGFDSPQNDSMALHAGQNRWFSDFAKNFSTGYTQSALTTGLPTTQVSAASVSSGPGGSSPTIQIQYNPVFDFASPSDRRSAMRVLSQQLKRQGLH